MTYTTYDFAESIKGQGIEPESINAVLAAWGYNGDYSEWTGGFLLEMADGTFSYITGWCDTTGWGCQDGTEICRFETMPELGSLKQSYGDEKYDWDMAPSDLNRYIRGEIERYD
jgi:hypothetical protein